MVGNNIHRWWNGVCKGLGTLQLIKISIHHKEFGQINKQVQNKQRLRNHYLTITNPFWRQNTSSEWLQRLPGRLGGRIVDAPDLGYLFYCVFAGVFCIFFFFFKFWSCTRWFLGMRGIPAGWVEWVLVWIAVLKSFEFLYIFFIVDTGKARQCIQSPKRSAHECKCWQLRCMYVGVGSRVQNCPKRGEGSHSAQKHLSGRLSPPCSWNPHFLPCGGQRKSEKA